MSIEYRWIALFVTITVCVNSRTKEDELHKELLI